MRLSQPIILYDSTDLDNYNWRPADELARELIRDEGLETTLNWLSELPEGALRRSAWRRGLCGMGF